jgi:hypothetical protein
MVGSDVPPWYLLYAHGSTSIPLLSSNSISSDNQKLVRALIHTKCYAPPILQAILVYMQRQTTLHMLVSERKMILGMSLQVVN